MIMVNDKQIKYQENLTVNRLLALLNYKFPLIIVKINGKVIPRQNYKSTSIKDGDDMLARYKLIPLSFLRAIVILIP